MLFTLQRYEFFSKSQLLCTHIVGRFDVVYLAKVRIFQQITTFNGISTHERAMLFTLQRYEFFSKSQPVCCYMVFADGCCLPCKGTNFLANHNLLDMIFSNLWDVVYLAKVRIFQQITTILPTVGFAVGCCLPCKGTNFLANHNSSGL